MAAAHTSVSCSTIPSSSDRRGGSTKLLRDRFDVVEDIFEVLNAPPEVRRQLRVQVLYATHRLNSSVHRSAGVGRSRRGRLRNSRAAGHRSLCGRARAEIAE